jgi:hypothetical protein
MFTLTRKRKNAEGTSSDGEFKIDRILVSKAHPYPITHGWSGIRDSMTSDICKFSRNTVWKIECSNQEREDAKKLFCDKGFVVQCEGPVTQLGWDESILALTCHEFLAIAIPDYKITKLEEETHWTYKGEFSLHNCLVKRQKILNQLSVKERCLPLSYPDDTQVQSETRKDHKEDENKLDLTLVEKVTERIIKQMIALNQFNFPEDIKFHEVVVDDLEDTVLNRVSVLLNAKKEIKAAVVASYREVGGIKWKKVLRVHRNPY